MKIPMRSMKKSEPFTFKLSSIVVLFPLINILVVLVIGMYGKDNTTIQYVRAILFFLVIFFTIRLYGTETVSKTIIFFLAYIFCLLFAASDFFASFNIYLKVLITMLMYPVGYFVLNQYDKLIPFLKNFAIASFLLNVNYIYAQMFAVGRSGYLEDSFYYGYAGIGSTTTLAYFLLTTPLIADQYGNIWEKWFFRINIILSILFTFLVLKRSSILAFVIGYFVYILLTKQFKRYTKVVIGLAFISVLSSPLYLDTLLERYDARSAKIYNPTKEGRYNDIIVSLKLLETEGLKYALFGSEPFNTPKFFGTRRQVHVDYANILISTGLIGLFLYLYIYWLMAMKFIKLSKFISINQFYKDKNLKSNFKILIGSFFAVFSASLIVSISGGLHSVGDRAMLFLLLGSFSGILNRQVIMNTLQKPIG